MLKLLLSLEAFPKICAPKDQQPLIHQRYFIVTLASTKADTVRHRLVMRRLLTKHDERGQVGGCKDAGLFCYGILGKYSRASLLLASKGLGPWWWLFLHPTTSTTTVSGA